MSINHLLTQNIIKLVQKHKIKPEKNINLDLLFSYNMKCKKTPQQNLFCLIELFDIKNNFFIAKI
jgi:hypothetical protein